MNQPVDNDALLKGLRKLILFCDSKKESMRRLRIAGPTWRHQAAGKRSAYNEVKKQLYQLAEELGMAEELAPDFAAAADEKIGFTTELKQDAS